MIRFIDGLPENVVAVEAVGKVASDDYKDLLEPALTKAIETHGSGRFL